MIVPGLLVCIIVLISVGEFIVSKALLISSVTVIIRAGRAIWLNTFATVLVTVCSAVTVECFVPVLRGCVWYVCCYLRKMLFSRVFAITERVDMGLYVVSLSNILTAYTHATQTTVNASQSPQQPHPNHRVPRQPHRPTNDYHRTTNTTQAHRPSIKSERYFAIL